MVAVADGEVQTIEVVAVDAESQAKATAGPALNIRFRPLRAGAAAGIEQIKVDSVEVVEGALVEAVVVVEWELKSSRKQLLIITI